MTGTIVGADHAEGSARATGPLCLAGHQQVLSTKAEADKMVAVRRAVHPEEALICVQLVHVLLPAWTCCTDEWGDSWVLGFACMAAAKVYLVLLQNTKALLCSELMSMKPASAQPTDMTRTLDLHQACTIYYLDAAQYGQRRGVWNHAQPLKCRPSR